MPTSVDDVNAAFKKATAEVADCVLCSPTSMGGNRFCSVKDRCGFSCPNALQCDCTVNVSQCWRGDYVLQQRKRQAGVERLGRR